MGEAESVLGRAISQFVIASAAKQSTATREAFWIDSSRDALLAMTNKGSDARGVGIFFRHSRESGNPVCNRDVALDPRFRGDDELKRSR
jgi:hypothetical protein